SSSVTRLFPRQSPTHIGGPGVTVLDGLAVGTEGFDGVAVGVLVPVGVAADRLVAVAVGPPDGVTVGLRGGVTIDEPVGVRVGVAPDGALAGNPTRLDIAAGGVTVESRISAVQVSCADVLTIRASPCAMPAVVITAVSRNALVPVVPKVTVAPGAALSTAP